MSVQLATILTQVRESREKAATARRLASGIGDEKAASGLLRYANELEASALRLENTALALAETLERTQKLTDELRSSVERLRKIRQDRRINPWFDDPKD
jgi:predicted  nucleic acid-binding Zn-ribbon protein